MSETVSRYISKLDPRSFTNNTQRALYTLLRTENKGGWVSRGSVRVRNATSRIRELRQEQFGRLPVECRAGREIRSNVSRSVYYYRVDRKHLSIEQLRRVFHQ